MLSACYFLSGSHILIPCIKPFRHDHSFKAKDERHGHSVSPLSRFVSLTSKGGHHHDNLHGSEKTTGAFWDSRTGWMDRYPDQAQVELTEPMWQSPLEIEN